MMDEYDISVAFKAIENDLISSMMRNMDRHRAEEDKDGMNWSMWQAEQLKSLERYKIDNQKRFGKEFKNINAQIKTLIMDARSRGDMEQEIAIFNAIRNGFKGAKKISKGATAEFFRLNDRKMDALIQATTHDMQKAETAVLRMANDQYRKAIFSAQVYANSGAGTYEKAVDMATKNMLSTGLNCVEYKNGARHTLSDYADMAIRTASKRAYLQGEGEKRQEWGISTVIINKRGNPCPKCLPFVGKVLVDDVWSGGKAEGAKYPLMSQAISRGLFHPRCKDSHSTYFPGISTADDTWTKAELDAIEKKNHQESNRQNAKRQAEKFVRLSKNSIDKENQDKYSQKASEWHEIVDNMPEDDIMKSEWTREAIEARTRDEKILSGYNIEHAVLYSSDGKRIFHKTGQAHSVGFTDDEIKKMFDGVLTHNHPMGATFSGADINMLRVAKLKEIRAIGKNGVYTMRQPKAWPEAISTRDKIENAYLEIQESLKEEMYNLYRSGKINDTYNIVYQDKIMTNFTEKYGLTYGMEVME